jgi:hypothetical protein
MDTEEIKTEIEDYVKIKGNRPGVRSWKLWNI